MTSGKPLSEVQILEAKVGAFFTHILQVLHIIHAATPNAAPLPPAPPVAITDPLAGNDPTTIVGLSPELALTLGQQGVENLHYYNYLRALTAAQLAAWCVEFLTQAGAVVADPTQSHATVSINGTAYDCTSDAQGIILFLANHSGATFPLT